MSLDQVPEPPRATNYGNPSGNQTLSGANQDNSGEDDEEDHTG